MLLPTFRTHAAAGLPYSCCCPPSLLMLLPAFLSHVASDLPYSCCCRPSLLVLLPPTLQKREGLAKSLLTRATGSRPASAGGAGGSKIVYRHLQVGRSAGVLWPKPYTLGQAQASNHAKPLQPAIQLSCWNGLCWPLLHACSAGRCCMHALLAAAACMQHRGQFSI